MLEDTIENDLSNGGEEVQQTGCQTQKLKVAIVYHIVLCPSFHHDTDISKPLQASYCFPLVSGEATRLVGGICWECDYKRQLC